MKAVLFLAIKRSINKFALYLFYLFIYLRQKADKKVSIINNSHASQHAIKHIKGMHVFPRIYYLFVYFLPQKWQDHPKVGFLYFLSNLEFLCNAKLFHHHAKTECEQYFCLNFISLLLFVAYILLKQLADHVIKINTKSWEINWQAIAKSLQCNCCMDKHCSSYF